MSGDSENATRPTGSNSGQFRDGGAMREADSWVPWIRNALFTLAAIIAIFAPIVYVSNQLAVLTERIDSQSLALNGKIDNLSGRIDGLERRFDGFERRFDRFESRLGKIESMMSEMQVDLGIVLYRLDERSARALGTGEVGDTE